MKREDVSQISFENGIIENVKQDAFGDKLTGLLYLQNYNPNIEHLSLIKRPGIVTVSENSSPYDIIGLQGIPPNADGLAAYSPNWYGIVPLDSMKDPIYCSFLLKTSNPRINDTYVLFARRYVGQSGDDFCPHLGIIHPIMATGIIARTIETQLDSPTFKEPFYDGRTSPGWYPLGVMRDLSRYGESITFVTTPELYDAITGLYYDNTNNALSYLPYLYPCYRFLFWNISEKRKEDDSYWWNGLDASDLPADMGGLPNTKLWKVQYPSLWLTRNGVIGHGYICTDATTYNTVATGTEPESGIRTNVLITNNDKLLASGDNLSGIDLSKDISIIFTEYNLRHDGYFENAADRDPNINTNDNTTMNWHCDYTHGEKIDTIERLKDERGTSDIVDQFTMFTKSNPQAITLYGSNGKGWDIFGLEGANGDYVSYRWGDSPDKKCLAPALSMAFPDYIKNKWPRLWLKDDKIPFVLTAIIKGYEVLLYRGMYTVRQGAIPVMPLPDNIGPPDNLSPVWHRYYDHANSLKVKLIYKVNWFLSPPDELMVDTWLAPSDPAGGGNGILDGDSDDCGNILWDPYIALRFALRITERGFTSLIDNEVQSINFYVSEPDEGNTIFRSIGRMFTRDPDPLPYAFPKVTQSMQEEENDLTHYRLVKKFIIDGQGQSYDNYEKYNGEPTESAGWHKEAENPNWANAETTIWSIPQEDQVDDGNAFPEVRNDLSNIAQNNPTSWDESTALTNSLTPDFLLWDYPADAPPLALGSSGKYWKGLGAEQVSVCQTRVFLGNCVDEKGITEQAIVRYSAVQNGVASPDVFVEEDKMTVGHLRHTALIEYREELMIFNRETYYRLAFPEILNAATWQFLETTQGHGTYSPKTVCVTPHGVCYANDNGIWLTTGGLPESLTDNPQAKLSVKSLYQNLAIGKSYIFMDMIDLGKPIVDSVEMYNKYMELMYDNLNDELVLITPIKNIDATADETEMPYELRLILNFTNRNWRVEIIDLEMSFPQARTVCKIGNVYHRQHFNNNAIITTRLYGYNALKADYYVEYGEPNIEFYEDVYCNSPLFVNAIEGIFLTHDVGNGIDDYLLHSIILECSPMDTQSVTYKNQVYSYDGWQSFAYGPNAYDPKLFYEPRARMWKAQSIVGGEVGIAHRGDNEVNMELIRRNWLARGGGITGISPLNPFVSNMQLPKAQAVGSDINDYAQTSNFILDDQTCRESLIILAPIQTKFRRKRFKFISKIVTKLRQMDIRVAVYPRRSV